MDKLERYIIENKSSLDILSPSDKCNERFRSLLNDQFEGDIIVNKSSLDHHSPSSDVWDRIEKELSDQELSLENIKGNTEFDKYTPSNNLWDKISNDLDKDTQKEENNTSSAKEVKFKINYQWITSLAAAIIIGVGIGWFGKFQTGSENVVKASKADKEWNTAEGYYMNVIQTKQLQIKQLNFEDIKLLNDFNNQLKGLQRNYKGLKKELDSSQQPELIRKQMVIVLELQIELLNKQMEIIIDHNKKEENHEDVKKYNI
ncbi:MULTISPECIES: hypothetical protein [Flammeovirga]|uniref:Uncharacterized protein n=1 Tax=Flammeovirga agarivorans TaxID=2726742 RepID=A0A7X8SI45_9BACT|nr:MULTISPECIES: hypothetical protein [Flammeovirga]NLR90636.1 hypothetical protein [Flammeovirga agarivorans]